MKFLVVKYPVMKNLVLSVFLIFTVPAVTTRASAQSAPADANAASAHAYSILGSWKLNVAKCDFGDGTKLREMTLKVTSATADLIEFSASATYDSGSQGTYSFKAPVDGKDHALTGSASTYSYSDESGVLIETQKDPDGTVTKGSWSVTANGKEGTWTYTVTNPDASITHQKLVFTRIP